MNAEPPLHLVDPELRTLLDAFPPLALSLESPPQIRADSAELWQRMRAASDAAPSDGVQVAERLVPGPPALITLGQLDLFLEEDVDFAMRLMQGVSPLSCVFIRGLFMASASPARPRSARRRAFALHS